MDNRNPRSFAPVAVLLLLASLALPVSAAAQSACEVMVWVAGDRVWEPRPKPFGTACGNNGFCNGVATDCIEPEVGSVAPKFLIASVRYAAPGYSTVTYANTWKTGTATSVSKSFSNTNGASVTVGFSLALSTGSASATVSYNDTWTKTETDSVSIEHEASVSETVDCVVSCSDEYIDHRNDLIYVITRPRVVYEAFHPGSALPPGRKHVTWGLDLSAAATKRVRVGELNGTIPMDALRKKDLAAFGILESDYADVLSAAGYPFSSAPAWTGSWRPDPSRFQYGGKLFEYSWLVGNSSYTLTDGLVIDHNITNSRSYAVDVKVEAAGSLMKGLLSVSASASGNFSWVWTNTSSRSTSNAQYDTRLMNILRPSPAYSGPANLALYIDRLYQTFLITYCSAPPYPDLMHQGCAVTPPPPEPPVTRVRDGAGNVVGIDYGFRATGAPTQSPVAVSWKPATGAKTNRLLRGTSAAGPFQVLADVDGNSYLDATATNKATPYYYKVVPLNDGGAGAEYPLAIVPAVPSLSVARSGTTAALTWQPKAEATSYTVWRSVNSNAFYAALSSVTSPYFVDAAPPAGVKHFYVVTSNSASGSSGYSNEVSVQSAPPPPTGLVTSSGNGFVSVRWTAAAGATGYHVQRSLDAVTWSEFAAGSNVTTTYATDSGLANGVTYYYRVQAMNAAGASAYSGAVAGRPVAPPPPPPVDPGCKKGICL